MKGFGTLFWENTINMKERGFQRLNILRRSRFICLKVFLRPSEQISHWKLPEASKTMWNSLVLESFARVWRAVWHTHARLKTNCRKWLHIGRVKLSLKRVKNGPGFKTEPLNVENVKSLKTDTGCFNTTSTVQRKNMMLVLTSRLNSSDFLCADWMLHYV